MFLLTAKARWSSSRTDPKKISTISVQWEFKYDIHTYERDVALICASHLRTDLWLLEKGLYCLSLDHRRCKSQATESNIIYIALILPPSFLLFFHSLLNLTYLWRNGGTQPTSFHPCITRHLLCSLYNCELLIYPDILYHYILYFCNILTFLCFCYVDN